MNFINQNEFSCFNKFTIANSFQKAELSVWLIRGVACRAYVTLPIQSVDCFVFPGAFTTLIVRMIMNIHHLCFTFFLLVSFSVERNYDAS